MQPTFPHNNRQRPLQKSMFLPTTQQYQHRNNSVQYQYQDIMKRSSINPDTNQSHNYLNNQNNNNFGINSPNNFQQLPQNNVQPPVVQYNVNSNPILNFNSTPRHKQNAKFNQFDQYNSQQDNALLQQINQKIQKLNILVQSHEQILKRNNKNTIKQQKQGSLIDTRIQQMQSKFRQNLIPSVINKETKQIYQHIFNFKMQINSIRQQISQVKKHNQDIQLSIASKLPQKASNNINHNSNNNNSSTMPSQPFKQINSNILSIQQKLQQVQKSIKLKDQQIKSLVQTELQKNKYDLQFTKSSPKLKQSTIQSTLTPIMIEYQELFCIKTQKSNIHKINLTNNRNKQETEILINSSIYYIDKEGYLLDNQNRYIVDAKGLQIKLQEKHLTLLKQHHVLN